MLRKSGFVTAVVTGYLLLYNLLAYFGAGENVIGPMFFLSPFLMFWLTITILKDKSGKIEELKEGEEFGYAGKDRDTLNVF